METETKKLDFTKLEEEEKETLQPEKEEKISNALQERFSNLTDEEKKDFDIFSWKEKYSFIPLFFMNSGFKVIKLLSEAQNRYCLYKEHPYLKYIQLTKHSRTDLEEELLNIFEMENPDWFLEYGRFEDGKKELISYLKKMPRAHKCINDPAQPIIFKDYTSTIYFNYFQSSELLVNRPNSQNDFPTIKAIILNLCENNEKYYNWFMDWLAFLYQNPTYRFNTSVIFTGSPGAGKGALSLALLKIFGITCYIGNSRDLSSNFNAQLLEGKLLLLANEVLDQNKRYQFSNDLKTLVSDKDISVEKKFQDRYMAKNYMKLIFFSNSHNPISIEENDRRYCVFRAGKLTLPHEILKKYHEDTDDFFTNEVLGFATHLNNRPVFSNIATDPPIMTEAKLDIVNLNETDFKGHILDLIRYNVNDWEIQPRNNAWYILFNRLYLAYKREHERDTCGLKKFAAKLGTNGFSNIRTTINGQNAHWVLIPEALAEELKTNWPTIEDYVGQEIVQEKNTTKLDIKPQASTNREYTEEEIIQKFAGNRNIPKEYKPEDIIKILKKQNIIYEPRNEIYKLTDNTNI